MTINQFAPLYRKCFDKHPVLIRELILESGVDLMEFWIYVDTPRPNSIFELLIKARDKQQLEKNRERISNVIAEMYKKDAKATHRENQLVHQFKVEAGIEKEMSAKELKTISSKRYAAFLSLKNNEPTESEIKTVLFLLKPYPEALKKAMIALNK